MRRRFASALTGFLVAAFVSAPARAGPPYLSDDPVPTDPGHWEIYNYVTGFNGGGGFSGEAGVDLNYGAAKDLQLTAVFPLALESGEGVFTSGFRGGPGIIELAFKYRFTHQSEGSWAPDVSVFPRLFVPTASRFSTGRANLFLPVWAQKDVGPWSLFGGGGYQINPGPGQLNFWQGGVALSRAFGKRFTLGGELYGQGRTTSEPPGGGYTALNLATTYRLTPHWSLLASAGPTWEEGGTHGQVFYVSLKADY